MSEMVEQPNNISIASKTEAFEQLMKLHESVLVEIQHYRQENEEIQRKLNEKEKRIDELNDENDKLHEAITEKDAEILTLSAEASTLRNRIVNITADKITEQPSEENDDTINKLKTELTETKIRLESAEAQVIRLRKTIEQGIVDQTPVVNLSDLDVSFLTLDFFEDLMKYSLTTADIPEHLWKAIEVGLNSNDMKEFAEMVSQPTDQWEVSKYKSHLLTEIKESLCLSHIPSSFEETIIFALSENLITIEALTHYYEISHALPVTFCQDFFKPTDQSESKYLCQLCGEIDPAYKFKLDEKAEWYPIDIQCRQRLVAAANLFGYIKQARLGLLSHKSTTEKYFELLQWRRNLFYARFGSGYFIVSDFVSFLNKFKTNNL